MAHYDEPGSFEAQFPAELESVVASRRMVAAALQSWDLNGAVGSDAALTVSELVTNSILHAGTSVALAVRRLGNGVRIEVRDGSAHLPMVYATRPEDLLANRSMTGRGLALVADVADRWGADPVSEGGKVVWAELGTGQRLVSSSPPPAYPPPPPPPTLAPAERAAGLMTTSTVTGGGRQIHLVGVPARLLVESTRQLTDLQREIQVMAMDHGGPPELESVVAANRDLTAQMDTWSDRDLGRAEAALARGEQRLDFDVTVPADFDSMIERFMGWFRKVTSSVVRRHLLTLPPSDEVLAYRKWYRDEIISQLSGRPPQPCPLEVPDPV